jgi:hypothetical protein
MCGVLDVVSHCNNSASVFLEAPLCDSCEAHSNFTERYAVLEELETKPPLAFNYRLASLEIRCALAAHPQNRELLERGDGQAIQDHGVRTAIVSSTSAPLLLVSVPQQFVASREWRGLEVKMQQRKLVMLRFAMTPDVIMLQSIGRRRCC